MRAMYYYPARRSPYQIFYKFFSGTITVLCFTVLCGYTIHAYSIWHATHNQTAGKINFYEYTLKKRALNHDQLPKSINGAPIDVIAASVQTKGEQELLYSFAQVNQNDYEISQPINIDASSNENAVIAFIKGDPTQIKFLDYNLFIGFKSYYDPLNIEVWVYESERDPRKTGDNYPVTKTGNLHKSISALTQEALKIRGKKYVQRYLDKISSDVFSPGEPLGNSW